ncbi:hypothetical protein SSX86_000803 [Deinandra increscens subsp. villosa]|uniref:Uncharacterized protein n=1 Tax=Deinandra increscens subsp. villosa TaxID=3103831 RepID=A0AAP0DXV3_9ASTR
MAAAPKKPSSAVVKRVEDEETARSLPVNVPDWSKIVVGKEDFISELSDDRSGKPIPRHDKFLARRRNTMASFEGNGRFLMKKRDLSKVRTGGWDKIGFNEED